MDVNKLDTTALRLLASKPHVPFDPASHVQVDFQGCTITQKLKPTLRKKILLPAFRRYCKRRMGWSSTTFDVIDWDLFRPEYHKQAKKSGISRRGVDYIESTTAKLPNAAHAELMSKMTITFSNVQRDLTF